MTLPRRCGKSWSVDEERCLLQDIEERKTYGDIATCLQRTEGEIRMKLHDIVYRLYLQRESIDIISKITNFSPILISTIIEYKRIHDFKKINDHLKPRMPDDISSIVCDLVKYNKSMEEICLSTDLSPSQVTDILIQAPYVDTTRRTVFEQMRMM